MVDGSSVALDLLQCFIAARVPDGDGPILTARHQQSPRWIQTNGVHLEVKKVLYFFRFDTNVSVPHFV